MIVDANVQAGKLVLQVVQASREIVAFAFEPLGVTFLLLTRVQPDVPVSIGYR